MDPVWAYPCRYWFQKQNEISSCDTSFSLWRRSRPCRKSRSWSAHGACTCDCGKLAECTSACCRRGRCRRGLACGIPRVCTSCAYGWSCSRRGCRSIGGQPCGSGGVASEMADGGKLSRTPRSCAASRSDATPCGCAGMPCPRTSSRRFHTGTAAPVYHRCGSGTCALLWSRTGLRCTNNGCRRNAFYRLLFELVFEYLVANRH